MPKKEMAILERINPLGWLRRRGLGKHEREWRIVELGQVCPRCAVPLEVSFEGNLTWYRCPRCQRGWGAGVNSSDVLTRDGSETRARDRGANAKRVDGLCGAVINFISKRSDPNRGTLAAMIAAEILVTRFGPPVAQETYRKILEKIGLRDLAPSDEETEAAGPRESGEPDKMFG
jgi:Zn-finger nucleic acid-binding protein